jgi:hypothetical protein
MNVSGLLSVLKMSRYTVPLYPLGYTAGRLTIEDLVCSVDYVRRAPIASNRR